MNRKKGSGWPRLATTEEDTDLIEDLICSQEEAPHTHLVLCKIAEQTGMQVKWLAFMWGGKMVGNG